MSWNRNRYDGCAYQKDLSQSTSSLNYTMDANKHFSCSDCRVEFGLLGGNNVSLTRGNMVDLESDLRNQVRQSSRCPERKYLPSCDKSDPVDGLPCKPTDNNKHLKACNMIQYAPRINHVGYSLKFPGCPASQNGGAMQYPPQLNPIQWKGQTQDNTPADNANKSKLHAFDSRTH